MSLPINFNYFTGNEKTIPGDTSEPEAPTSKRKRKSTSSSDIVVANVEPEVPICQTNKPYQETYNETNGMLRQSIAQIDGISNDIITQISDIKNSKTLKRKYDYLGSLMQTEATLVNTKISAIREMNNTISHCHDLEMKRAKDIMKIDSANKVDDDRAIMDMYNAFISAPTGAQNIQYAPPIGMMTANERMQSYAIPPVGVKSGESYDAGYSNYINNITPEQNMMILEGNPNVKTVVRYDPDTGKRCFDVVDMTTMQSIPNTPKPAPLFLQDATLDLAAGIAKNSNLNTVYPIVITPGLA